MERDVSARIAKEKGGDPEYRLPDGSRVDVLTEGVAYEVEWPEKWQQGVGQALFYALSTDRRPGLILILTNPAEQQRYYLRALSVCARSGIKLETVTL